MRSTNYVMIYALEKIYILNEIFKNNLAHGANYKAEFSELGFALDKTCIPFKHRALNHNTTILIRIPEWTISVNPFPCSIVRFEWCDFLKIFESPDHDFLLNF